MLEVTTESSPTAVLPFKPTEVSEFVQENAVETLVASAQIAAEIIKKRMAKSTDGKVAENNLSEVLALQAQLATDLNTIIKGIHTQLKQMPVAETPANYRSVNLQNLITNLDSSDRASEVPTSIVTILGQLHELAKTNPTDAKQQLSRFFDQVKRLIEIEQNLKRQHTNLFPPGRDRGHNQGMNSGRIDQGMTGHDDFHTTKTKVITDVAGPFNAAIGSLIKTHRAIAHQTSATQDEAIAKKATHETYNVLLLKQLNLQGITK